MTQTTDKTAINDLEKTPDNVADFATAQSRKDQVRVRLDKPVEYDGETLNELWMRRPTMLDGVIASNKAGKSNNALVLSMVASCAGVDLEWLQDQPARVANKLLKAYTESLKDPMHVAAWDDMTLTLFKPIDVNGKTVTSVTLKEPTTRDLMDDTSNEKVYELVARLIGLSVSDIKDMDYLHDYSELVKKVNTFRD